MDIVEIKDRNADLLDKLTSVWKRSVVKSHLFLSKTIIDDIANFIPQDLINAEHLIVAKDKNKYLGFMGITKQKLELLFLDAPYIGQGIGRKLVEYGIEKYQINEVTANEQNPKAVGFYEHLGFMAYKRTETDEQGRPFPLIYMRR